MAEVEGKTIICDLCGKTVFLKYVEDTELDGGFTRLRRYEKKPDGWDSVWVRGYSTLCPTCCERIAAAIETAVSDIQQEVSDA